MPASTSMLEPAALAAHLSRDFLQLVQRHMGHQAKHAAPGEEAGHASRSLGFSVQGDGDPDRHVTHRRGCPASCCWRVSVDCPGRRAEACSGMQDQPGSLDMQVTFGGGLEALSSRLAEKATGKGKKDTLFEEYMRRRRWACRCCYKHAVFLWCGCGNTLWAGTRAMSNQACAGIHKWHADSPDTRVQDRGSGMCGLRFVDRGWSFGT